MHSYRKLHRQQAAKRPNHQILMHSKVHDTVAILKKLIRTPKRTRDSTWAAGP